MTLLQEFAPLAPDRHNPAVGINYGKFECEGTISKLLIVGLSHYDEVDERMQQPDYTHNLINQVIEGDAKIPFFTKVAGIFRKSDGAFYSPAEFYPQVAFYNYLPDHFEAARQSVPDDLFTAESTAEFFYAVLKTLKPTHVLVTGATLWRWLPSNPKPESASDLTLLLSSAYHKDEQHAWWYPSDDEDYALVAGIFHPSSASFNAEDLRKWIPKFLRFKQRGDPAETGIRSSTRPRPRG